MDEKDLFDEEVQELEQLCWKDISRRCGSECVSYDARCERDPAWMPCLLLNVQRAQAKSFSNLAAELKRFNDKKDAEDQATRETLGQLQKFRRSKEYAEAIRDLDPGPPEVK